MSHPTWYRVAGIKTYHAEGPDWVRTGIALCGRPIPHVGFSWASHLAVPAHNACKDCLRKLAKGVSK